MIILIVLLTLLASHFTANLVEGILGKSLALGAYIPALYIYFNIFNEWLA